MDVHRVNITDHNFGKFFLLLFLCVMSPTSALASGLQGSVTLASEYIAKRGISLTDDKPAVQVDVSYTRDNVGYLGLWASNVDNGDVTGEVDIYAGTSVPVDSKWALGLAVLYYENIGDQSQNFSEYILNVNHGEIVTVGYHYTPDFSGLGMSSGILLVTNKLPVTETIKFIAKVGHVSFEDQSILEDYSLIDVGLFKSFDKSSLGFRYSNTTSSQFNGRAGENYYFTYAYSL